MDRYKSGRGGKEYLGTHIDTEEPGVGIAVG